MDIKDIDYELTGLLADGYAVTQKFDICVTARRNPGVPVAFTTRDGSKQAILFPGPEGYQYTYTDVIAGEPTTVTRTHRTWMILES